MLNFDKCNEVFRSINSFTPGDAHRALIAFTLSNATKEKRNASTSSLGRRQLLSAKCSSEYSPSLKCILSDITSGAANFINEEIKCEGSPLCFLSSSIPAYHGEVESQSQYIYINPSYMTTIVAGSAGSKEKLSGGKAPSKTLANYIKDYGLVFSHFDEGYSMHG